MSNKLTIEELHYVQNEIKQKGKSLSISYLLLLTFGLVGIHLGYLERTKSAILRSILTILTVFLLYPISKILIEFNSTGVTTQLQQYSSLFLVIACMMIGLNVIWTIYDLVSLPTMVKEMNSKIEEKLNYKVLEARYVKEKIKREEISDLLVEEISQSISSKLDSHISKQENKVNEDLLKIEENLMDKRGEILDLVDHVSLNIEQLKGLYSEFDSLAIEVKKSQEEKINSLKIYLEEEASKIVKETEIKLKETEQSLNIKEENVDVEELRKEITSISLESNEEILSVTEALVKEKGVYSIKGFIVGNMSPNRQRVFFDYFDNEMNVAIAQDPNETDREKMIIVQLTWDSGLRNSVGLISNKNNLNRPVVVKGELVDYFKGAGLKNVISVEFIDTKDKFISNDIKK